MKARFEDERAEGRRQEPGKERQCSRMRGDKDFPPCFSQHASFGVIARLSVDDEPFGAL